jgi:transcriptional regulator with XRE-family HTH domain
MIVRKLRLERGWSQEHLAQVSGLNTRTIQRIESGQTPGLESLKSLAAVFEIDISQLDPKLQQEPPMNQTSSPSDNTYSQPSPNVPTKPGKYTRAKLQALFARFVLLIAMLWTINLLTNPHYLWAIFPTIGLSFAMLFIALSALSPNDAGEPTLLDSIDKSMASAPVAPPPYTRNTLIIEFVRYLLVIGMLLVINFMISPEYFWVKWPALGWGIMLASKAANVFIIDPLKNKLS